MLTNLVQGVIFLMQWEARREVIRNIKARGEKLSRFTKAQIDDARDLLIKRDKERIWSIVQMQYAKLIAEWCTEWERARED